MSLDELETEDDPRYTLTKDEEVEVVALKERCDEEGVQYLSIFELAKYCFVSSSIKDEKKRRDDSFQRIKKKRLFETKHKLMELDLLESVAELQENIPDWAISCGKVNDKWCIGYTSAGVNLEYMAKAIRVVYKVELNRYDLGAADLEEARKGFYIMGTSLDLKVNPLRSVRLAVKLKAILGKMNANRVKGIYLEAPKSVIFFSNIFLAIMPKTIKDRIKLISSLKSCKALQEFESELETALPPKLGGTYEQTLKDWFEERLAARKTTDLLVKLEK